MTIIMFFIGLAVLTAGAEALIRGASRLALRLGLSPLVIGLTVVAYGTSTPELVVSAKAALSGQSGIALGNVVGSNIFNVLFILGLSACLLPLVVSRPLIWREVPIMIGASLLAGILSLDGRIGRLEGVLFLILLGAYTIYQISQARGDPHPEEAVPAPAAGQRSSLAFNAALITAGLIMLGLGARWMVDAAVVIAKNLGVSDLIIGLTIVAAGTSLPEVATSILATLRGQRDLAVGNVVGSNIYNLLGVLGLAAVLGPIGVPVDPSALRFDIPMMIVTALACLPIFLTGHRIDRWEGAFFLFAYAAYVIYLILASQSHDLLPAYSRTMFLFAIPLTSSAIIAFWTHMRIKKGL